MQAKPHLMIVEARFYEDIADQLVSGAVAEIETAGATYERFAVPGAFEVPAAIRFAVDAIDAVDAADAASGHRRFDGFVALGCVVRGETSHFDYVCAESARGLQDLAAGRGLAIGYGILTVDNRDQARARAAVDGVNKGGSAARAALEMIALRERLRQPAP